MFDEAWGVWCGVVSVMGTILEVGVGAGEAGDWVGWPGIVAVVVRVVVRRDDAGPTYRLGPPPTRFPKCRMQFPRLSFKV